MIKTSCCLLLLFCFLLTAQSSQSAQRGALSRTHRRHQRSAQKVSAKERNKRIREAAFAQPFNAKKLAAYKATLPRVDDYYIVEGDIALTEQELKDYVFEQHERLAQEKNLTKGEDQKQVQASPELTLSTYNSAYDFYKDPAKRHLTYAIDKRAFTAAQYATLLSSMEEATQEWEQACPACLVRFEHLSLYDSNPSFAKVSFIVRPYNFFGKFLAYSFFPHDPPVRHYLSIDPGFFNPQLKFSRAGILRHELGHILGYKHEQIRGIGDCYQNEGNQWVPLTDYDRLSVMHYFCPSGQAGTLDLHLSTLDIQGHQKLYGLKP